MTYLAPEQARAIYSRIGRWQDTQGCYERRPIARMFHAGAFGRARSVVEFGCGAGRLARELLRRMPADARYLGLDVADRMVELASERVRPWGTRAAVRPTDGTITLPIADGACDRVVSTYVLDLLSPEDARTFVTEARRVLAPDGLLCLVSLGIAPAGVARLVGSTWLATWSRRPSLVGGCRPIRLADALEPDAWEVEHHEIVSARGIASEVLIARPRTTPVIESSAARQGAGGCRFPNDNDRRNRQPSRRRANPADVASVCRGLDPPGWGAGRCRRSETPFGCERPTAGCWSEREEVTGITGTPSNGTVTVAGRLSKDLAPGTWGSILRQAGLR